MENILQEGDVKIIYVYVTKMYESQRQANVRYREKNRLLVQQQQRLYSKNRYEQDTEYREKKKLQAKERHAKNKAVVITE